MDNIVVPGSAADVVKRQKEAQLRTAEKMINEMDDFPQLKRVWEAVKKDKENGCDGR